MNYRNTAIVIVPGAWQQVTAFTNFVDSLRNAGYLSEAVALPSVGSTSDILPGIAEDVAAVRRTVSKFLENFYNVILLCHSYGGLVGSNATEGLDVNSRLKQGKTCGIIQVLYMSAFMVPNGCCLFDMMGRDPAPWMDVQGDKISVKSDMVSMIGFNDLSPDLAAKFSQQMTYSSFSTFHAPATYEPWSDNVPCACIFTANDSAISYPLQVQMAGQLGSEGRSVTLNAGHCPFLSVPDQVIEAIRMLSYG